MTTLDLANQAIGKLKTIKFPTINRTKLVKFFNEAFLDLHEEDLQGRQDTNVQAKK